MSVPTVGPSGAALSPAGDPNGELALERVGVWTSDLSPDVTVVVPTRNEASNVGELLQRLRASCAGFSLEVLFVDDSDDDTPDTIRMAGQTCPVAVGLLHRKTGQREGGLGTAVLTGLRHARGSWVVVMDGDLQHPPEVVNELVATGLASGVDLVVASRYTSAGSSQGLDGAFRKVVSGSASAVTRIVFSRQLAGVTDPMSGFFAFRRDRVDPEQLRPTGFKVLLDILIRTPGLRLAEVPFTFGSRCAGESKASATEGLRFLRHLYRLLADMLAVRLSHPIATFFGIATRQAIRLGTFASVPDLVAAIRRFIDGLNDRCEPFIWTKTPDEILDHAKPKKRKGTSFTHH